MKVAIVGSRDFAWHDTPWDEPRTEGKQVFIQQVVGRLTQGDYVVTGGAAGADFWAEYFAVHYKVSRIVHEAQWEKYGKSAGPIRNRLVVSDADVLFAFYSDKSKSRGTQNCVSQALKSGIPVFEYDAATEDEPVWKDTWMNSYADWYEAGVK